MRAANAHAYFVCMTQRPQTSQGTCSYLPCFVVSYHALIVCQSLSSGSTACLGPQAHSALQQPNHWVRSGRKGLTETGRLTGKASRAAVHKLRSLARDFWDVVGPGGKLHPEEFLEHHGDVLVQLALVGVLAVLLLQSAFKPSSATKDAPLSDPVGALLGLMQGLVVSWVFA